MIRIKQRFNDFHFFELLLRPRFSTTFTSRLIKGMTEYSASSKVEAAINKQLANEEEGKVYENSS